METNETRKGKYSIKKKKKFNYKKEETKSRVEDKKK